MIVSIRRAAASVVIGAVLLAPASALAQSVRVRAVLSPDHFPRVTSDAAGSAQIDVNPETGSFTMLGSFQGIQSQVTGVRVRLPGPRLPRPVGRRALFLPVGWSQNGENGTFSTGGMIPLRRVPSLLAGRATVEIRTTASPRGEIGGRLVQATPTAAGTTAALAGLGLLATRRRRGQSGEPRSHAGTVGPCPVQRTPLSSLRCSAARGSAAADATATN